MWRIREDNADAVGAASEGTIAAVRAAHTSAASPCRHPDYLVCHVDLEKFIPRGELDPVYFDRPNYLYPDGPIAVETLRVIGAVMAEAGVVGLGRLTLSRRERMVMVEPRGTGMALFARCG